MKNKTTILKIFLFMLIFIGLAIFAPSKVAAWSDSKLLSGITVGYENKNYNSYTLVGTENLYCIENGDHITSYKENKYYAIYKIVIKGWDATIYKASGDSWSEKVSTKCIQNARLAYVTAGGSSTTYPKYYGEKGNYTTRQTAIYYYWHYWVNNVEEHKKYFGNYDTEENLDIGEKNALVKEAYSYSQNENSTYKIADIDLVKTTGSNIQWTSYDSDEGTGTVYCYMDTNYIFGPFEVDFTGTVSLSITGLSSGYTICNSSGTKISITSGKPFYIKLNNISDMEKIKKIVITTTATSIKSTIYLLREENGATQRLLAVNDATCTTTDKVTITIESLLRYIDT